MPEILHRPNDRGSTSILVDGREVGEWVRQDAGALWVTWTGAETESPITRLYSSEEAINAFIERYIDHFQPWRSGSVEPPSADHTPLSLAQQPNMTPPPWEVHEETWPDGKIGWHVASAVNGRHICVATFHAEADARAIALVRNALKGAEQGLVGMAQRPSDHPFRQALDHLAEQGPTPDDYKAAEEMVSAAEQRSAAQRILDDIEEAEKS